jgi:serine/threonine protein phosphatase PrpC
VGRRSNNEDAFLADPRLGLFAVADGVGGYEGGEVASRLTVEVVAAFLRRNLDDEDATWAFPADARLSTHENLVSQAMRVANREVLARKTGVLAQMGSTIAALLVRDGKVTIGHLGDSRVYRLRGGALVQLTVDHSLYAELLAAGIAVPPRAECQFTNVITRAVGMSPDPAPGVRAEPAVAGDTYLLCTDGLTEAVPDERIAELLRAAPPEAAGKALVDEAYARGGRDNITAVVVAL